MIVRLGLAVPADLEPDVLIVDEVLAVGDEAFQRKCEARMAGFRDRRVTILLVSHNVEMVRSLCDRGVWLEEGAISAVGMAGAVAEGYHAASLP